MKKYWKPALLLVAIAVMVIGMLGSGAWFTDQATATPETLKSGTLSIRDGGVTSFDLGDLTNMAPGDITGPVTIVIENNGTLPLAWIGDLVVEADTPAAQKLKGAIYIDYALMQFEGGNWAEADDNFILNGDGSGPYPGTYQAMALASPFNLVTLDKFDGTSAMGVAPYEFTGALNRGYSYKLTLKFGMAPGADDTYQNLDGLKLGFVVKATQVKTGALTALHAPMINNYNWYLGTLNNQN